MNQFNLDHDKVLNGKRMRERKLGNIEIANRYTNYKPWNCKQIYIA